MGMADIAAAGRLRGAVEDRSFVSILAERTMAPLPCKAAKTKGALVEQADLFWVHSNRLEQHNVRSTLCPACTSVLDEAAWNTDLKGKHSGRGMCSHAQRRMDRHWCTDRLCTARQRAHHLIMCEQRT